MYLLEFGGMNDPEHRLAGALANVRARRPDWRGPAVCLHTIVNILSCNEAKNISYRNKNYSRKLKTIQKRLQGERRVRISLDFSSMFI